MWAFEHNTGSSLVDAISAESQNRSVYLDRTDSIDECVGRVIMVAAWQACTVFASLFAFDRVAWLFALLTAAALLVPFLGYILAVYGGNFLVSLRVLRLLLMILGSLALTLTGYYFLYTELALLTGRGYFVA